MKKLIRISILFIIIAILVAQTNVLANIFGPKSAFAVGDLQVNWGVPEGSPLFTLTNIAPGRSETRTLTIQNGATYYKTKGLANSEQDPWLVRYEDIVGVVVGTIR